VTHDIALKTPASNSRTSETPGVDLSIVLLTAEDVTDDCIQKVLERLQRLVASTGGLDIATIFLLDAETRQNDSLVAMAKLQER
jgi:hypothetical protein